MTDVVPLATPVTIPEAPSTDAMPGLVTLQVPPDAALARVIVLPGQRGVLPVIAAGSGLTLNVNVLEQPVLNV